MLWLCIHLPCLSLEALSVRIAADAAQSSPIAVFVTEKNKRRIVCSNIATLNNTYELTRALAIHPGLRPLERNAEAELAALKRLAGWAYQWSSYVTWREAQPHLQDYSALMWLEIGASKTLFGGYAALIRRIEKSLRALGYDFRFGVAPTLEGAAVLARAEKRVLVTSAKRLRQHLDSLPIVHLQLPRDTLYALEISGITTIGALLSLSSAPIARRFGPETTLYLRRVLGSAPDPRPAYRLPAHYAERSDFGFGVATVPQLLFPLQRMLHEFCGYLRALDIATQRYTLVLEHERNVVTRLDTGLAAPSRDAKRLFATLRERLQALELPSDVYAMRIEADDFTGPAVRQQGLFANDSEIADELGQTLEKIAARLGSEAVRVLETAADYRPEHAWAFKEKTTSKPSAPTAARPLWLLSQPLRLQNAPRVDSQCEVIEAGWWDRSVKRDYRIAHAATGEQCWVFFDARESAWYLQGYWS